MGTETGTEAELKMLKWCAARCMPYGSRYMLLAVCRNKISSRARHVARYTYTLRAEQAARAPTFACQ